WRRRRSCRTPSRNCTPTDSLVWLAQRQLGNRPPLGSPPASGLPLELTGTKVRRGNVERLACASELQQREPAQPWMLSPSALTLELSRTAKRFRLERIVIQPRIVPKPSGTDNCGPPGSRETAAASRDSEWRRKAEARGAAVTTAQCDRLRAAQHEPTEANHTEEPIPTRRGAARRRALLEPARSEAAEPSEANNRLLHDHV